MFRVLRPGGNLEFSLWAKPENHPRSRILAEAIEAHGEAPRGLPQGPHKFLFTERRTASELLSAAGFDSSSVHISTVSSEWQIPSARCWLDAERKGSVRTAAVLGRQPASNLENIRMAVDNAIQVYAGKGGYTIPAVTHLVVAKALKG